MTTFRGTIPRSTNGGSIWRRQPSGMPNVLLGVACPRPSTCVAVGERGTLLRSMDEGSTWRRQPSALQARQGCVLTGAPRRIG
jgi:photosystem II stability/assembly factor-like uncharacterized protein